MRRTEVEATPLIVRAVVEALTIRRLLILEEALLTMRAPITEKAVDEPFTIFRLLILDEALFTIRAPETVRAVVEAEVRVAVVAVRSTVRRLLIEDDALLTMRAPPTDSAVVDELVVMSLTTRRLLIDEEALFTTKAPVTSRLVVEALVVVNLVPSKRKAAEEVRRPLVVVYGIRPEAILEMVRPWMVRSPEASRTRAEADEVAKVVSEEVAKYKIPPALRSDQ